MQFITHHPKSSPHCINDLVVPLLEELDGGEALNLHILQLIGSGVHLGDNNSLRVLVLLPQFVPGRDQLLAVSTPRSIKLDQDILLNVHGDIYKVLSNPSLNHNSIKDV